jgi:hypothetical protein
MWKIALGFIVFAGVAVWMLSRGGDIDMGGEKHEISVPQTPIAAPANAASAAAIPAPGAAASASAASKL